MRRIILSICGFLLCAAACPVYAQPTTRPATRPVPAALKPVLVLPFVPPDVAAYRWLGKGIQQDLASALAQSLRLPVVAPSSARPAEDGAEALRAGRDADATYVVYGQIQIIGSEVRISGQTLETADGKPIAALKVTGPIDNFFRLEDTLTDQVVSAMPRPLLTTKGMASSRQIIRPQIIYLPSDPQTGFPSNRSLNPQFSQVYITPSQQPLPYAPPPYSPNYVPAYPGRFYSPYGQQNANQNGPVILFPLGGGFYIAH